MVQFSLQEDNHVWSAGSLWRRDDAIPMGGSFRAQCADLHSLWTLRFFDGGRRLYPTKLLFAVSFSNTSGSPLA